MSDSILKNFTCGNPCYLPNNTTHYYYSHFTNVRTETQRGYGRLVAHTAIEEGGT